MLTYVFQLSDQCNEYGYGVVGLVVKNGSLVAVCSEFIPYRL